MTATPTPTNLSQLEEAWERSREITPPADPYHMKPGIHFDIPFEEYCRIPALNKSSITQAKQSLAHYRWAPKMDDAPFLRFGTLVHDGKLEPEKLAERYVVIPDTRLIEQTQTIATHHEITGRKKAEQFTPYKSPKASGVYKDLVREFLAGHPGKQEVSEAWFNDLAGMLRSLEEDPLAVELFESGYPEVTIIWNQPIPGTPEQSWPLCKGRIDWLTIEAHQVDVKTAQDIFRWSVTDYDYHIQAASYLEGYRHAYAQMSPSARRIFPKALKPFTGTGKKKRPREIPFYFVVVEKTRPWTVLPAPTSPNALRVGSIEYHYLLQKIVEAEARRSDGIDMRTAWPQANPPDHWDLGRWYREGDFPLWIDHQDTNPYPVARD